LGLERVGDQRVEKQDVLYHMAAQDLIVLLQILEKILKEQSLAFNQLGPIPECNKIRVLESGLEVAR
jgi:hypothetical protein